jgi:hypothetical protein
MEKIKEVREHFRNEFRMFRDVVFTRMDCLYDYILSQDLCGVEE